MTTQTNLSPLPSGEHPWANRLRRARKRLSRARFAVTALFTFLLIWFGALQSWENTTAKLTTNIWLHSLIFVSGLAFLYGLIELPFSYVRSFLVEKRYGLLTQDLRGWLGDHAKGAMLAAVLGLIVVSGLIAALHWTGRAWWIASAAAATVFGILLTRLAPQLILPLFFKLKPIDSQELQNRFRALGERMGTPVLGIFEIDMSRRTKAANAAVIGFGTTRKAVVGDTLLKEFSNDEVEFVLAHELAHHHYNDLWLGVAIHSFLTFVSLGITGVVLGETLSEFNPTDLFWIALVASICDAILSPLGKFFSRFAETRADSFAAKATHNPQAGVSAFRKLGYQNIAVFEPPRWEEFFYYTHPSLARRIQRLES